jgi:hypothetical protein
MPSAYQINQHQHLELLQNFVLIFIFKKKYMHLLVLTYIICNLHHLISFAVMNVFLILYV